MPCEKARPTHARRQHETMLSRRQHDRCPTPGGDRVERHAVAGRIGAAVLAVVAAFCSLPTYANAQCMSTSQLIVNRRPVCADGVGDVLSLLRRHVSTQRIALHSESSDLQPLVVLDGLALVDGVERLANVATGDVQSVLVFGRRKPLHATAQKGRTARSSSPRRAELHHLLPQSGATGVVRLPTRHRGTATGQRSPAQSPSHRTLSPPRSAAPSR